MLTFLKCFLLIFISISSYLISIEISGERLSLFLTIYLISSISLIPLIPFFSSQDKDKGLWLMWFFYLLTFFIILFSRNLYFSFPLAILHFLSSPLLCPYPLLSYLPIISSTLFHSPPPLQLVTRAP